MHVYDQYICETPNEDTVSTYHPEQHTVSNWVRQYCSKNPWLIPINSAFINDNFNLYGLNNVIQNYQIALAIIKDKDPSDEIGNLENYEDDAINLYHLIHQRYLLTPGSIHLVQEKYNKCEFGRCPRVNCHHARLIPIGISPKCKFANIRLFCFSCNDVYNPPPDIVYDGAAFGPYFPMFFKKASTFNVNNCIAKMKNLEISYMGIPMESNDYLNRSAVIHPMPPEKKEESSS